MAEAGFEMVAGIGNTLFSTVGIIIGVVSILVFLWWSGMLNRYSHNVLLIIDRAGTKEFKMKKGRFIIAQAKSGNVPNPLAGEAESVSGQFEIQYGIGDLVRVEAPPEEYVYNGNWIIFQRRAMDDHRPCKLDVTPDSEVEIDPAMTPAAKIAFGTQAKTAALRFANPSPWEKYAPTMALVAAAIVLGLAFLAGSGTIAQSFAEGSAKVSGPWQEVSTKLANASVVIAKPAAAQPSPVSYYPSDQPPG